MLLRQAVKGLLLPLSLVVRERRAGVTFLIYHRATGTLRTEIDLPPALLARQMRFLAGRGLVVGLEEGLALLRGGRPLERDRIVLTFDDGYADFHGTVFPLLVALGIPATVYVTTGFVEGEHSPLSGRHPGSIRPLTWEMLRELHASGLVTVGAHSHAHRDYVGLAERAVAEDLDRSSELFERHLGFVPRHFAYPRARYDAAAEAVVRRRYDSAARWAAAPGRCPARSTPTASRGCRCAAATGCSSSGRRCGACSASRNASPRWRAPRSGGSGPCAGSSAPGSPLEGPRTARRSCAAAPTRWRTAARTMRASGATTARGSDWRTGGSPSST